MQGAGPHEAEICVKAAKQTKDLLLILRHTGSIGVNAMGFGTQAQRNLQGSQITRMISNFLENLLILKSIPALSFPVC